MWMLRLRETGGGAWSGSANNRTSTEYSVDGMPTGDLATIDCDPSLGCTVNVRYEGVLEEVDLGIFETKEQALSALQHDVNSRRS